MSFIKIQYILGRPGSGKTTLCHKEIADKQAASVNGNALILLVPEQFSFSSEKALIAATHAQGLSRAQVLSFHRLSYFVFSKTGGIDAPIMEDTGKNMLLRRLINQLKPQLLYFKSSQNKPGFVDALASSITEFYQYGIAPDDLASRAQDADSASLRMKLTDLHLIYSAYREYLEKTHISSDEIPDILAEKIPEAEFLRGAEIWVDGFKSFTPQEFQVLRALVSVAQCVKFTFCIDNESGMQADSGNSARHGPFFEADSSIAAITKMADELGADRVPHVFLHSAYRHANAPDLAFLCDHFTDFSQDFYPKTPENIRVFAAANLFEEVHATAKTAVMLTRDRGYMYSEIGLVASDLGLYENHISAIFSLYNIPVFLDKRRDILGHPLPHLLFAALEVISTNWQYEAVFAMLRSPFVQIPKPDIDVLENYVLATNIRGADWRKPFHLGKPEILEFVEPIREKVIAMMLPLADLTARRAFPLADIAHSVYTFLMHNQVTDALAGWITAAAHSGDNETMRRHEQIWGKTMDALDKIVEILGNFRENVGDFAKILEAGFGDLGLAPPSLDQLVVGDLRRSRFGELKALIVLGANEGLMMAAPAASGLLDDSDRATLAQSGLTLAKDSIAKLFEEEFLIYANLSKPSQYLTISYTCGSLDGKANLPSRLLGRLWDMFPRLKVTQLDGLPADSLALISTPAAAFSDLMLSLGALTAENKPIAPPLLDAYGFFIDSPKYAAQIQHISNSAEFYAATRKLSAKSTKTLYGRRIRTSVSRLERFVNCPFSYFAEYNLAARPRKLYQVEAVDMGNIYHDILAKFGEIVQKMGGAPDASDPTLQSAVSDAVNDVFANPDNRVLYSSGRYTHFARKMRRISQVSMDALLEHLNRGDFTLAFNEVAFTDKQNDNETELRLGAIQLPLDGGATLHLDGRIDRVDTFAHGDGMEYVKVIDYKSGRKKFSLSEAYHGLDLQLLVYLSAFIQKLSQVRGNNLEGQILPAAALYFNLLNPVLDYNPEIAHDANALRDELLKKFKMSGIVLDETAILQALDGTAPARSLPASKGGVSADDFKALMNHAMLLARTIGADILSGNIAAAPVMHNKITPCTYCIYHSLCRFDAADRHAYNHLRQLRDAEVMEKIAPQS